MPHKRNAKGQFKTHKSKPKAARRPAAPARPRGAPKKPTLSKGAPKRRSKAARTPLKAIGVRKATRRSVKRVKTGKGRLSTRQGKPTPARRIKRGPLARGLGGVVITLFKAEGSIGERTQVIYRGVTAADYEQRTTRWRKRHNKYVALQSSAPRRYPDAPGVWASNEGLFLGQVNFPGTVSLGTLIEMLGRSLGLVNHRTGTVGDFREAYPHWSYTYQIYRRPEKRDAKGRISLGKPEVLNFRRGRK